MRTSVRGSRSGDVERSGRGRVFRARQYHCRARERVLTVSIYLRRRYHVYVFATCIILSCSFVFNLSEVAWYQIRVSAQSCYRNAIPALFGCIQSPVAQVEPNMCLCNGYIQPIPPQWLSHRLLSHWHCFQSVLSQVRWEIFGTQGKERVEWDACCSTSPYLYLS